MANEDLVFESATIKLTETSEFSVSGLSLSDMLTLYYRHRTDLSKMFDRAVAAQKDGRSLNLDDVPDMVIGLLAAAPLIAADIIALGMGDLTPERAAQMLKLAFPKQLEALEAIARLTFSSDMPPKKVLALLARMASSVRATVDDLSAPQA